MEVREPCVCLRAVVGVFFVETVATFVSENKKSKAEGIQEPALGCLDVADLELIRKQREGLN